MILKGYTPSGKPLTVSNLQPSEVPELLEQLKQWPVEGANLERFAETLAARTVNFTTEIDSNTGFEVTRIGRDDLGKLAAWERLQVTDNHAFILNHWVTPEHRQKGYYRALTQVAQYLIFDVMKLEGVLWELPEWSEVVAKETKRNGFTVFYENEGRAVVGYTKQHYFSKLRKERKYKVETL